MRYYVGTIICDSNYLAHHGIKGQKWGTRRFQNEDGTLTAEGRQRYGSSEVHDLPNGQANSIVREGAKSSLFGRRHVADWRANRLDQKSKKWQEYADYDYRKDGFTKKESDMMRESYKKKADKLARKAEGQRAANANRKAYEAHTSTAKLIAQDVLLSKFGAQNYRAARARGEGRLRSLLEVGAGATPIGTILAMKGNKKAYGSRLVLSAFEDDE